MRNQISILIPVYREDCSRQVERLAKLCRAAQDADNSFRYEIIAADDGSGDAASIAANQRINEIDHCRFIAFAVNSGAAAMRNKLAKEAQHEWLLYMDCDMQLPDDHYIERYLNAPDAPLVNGGLRIDMPSDGDRHNLRYMYESKHQQEHTAERRQERPYLSFRSTNFLISRELMLSCPFDESFKKSGYEDVALGRSLAAIKADIMNIDNPLVMTDYEKNPAYMDKIDRSLLTLWQHRDVLTGYSGLLDLVEGMPSPARWLLRAWHKAFGKALRRNLSGSSPCLALFNIYRVGQLAVTMNKTEQ